MRLRAEQRGISTKEFLSVDSEGISHLVVFAYQGVRMYSRLMEMDKSIPRQIINEVKRLLVRRNGMVYERGFLHEGKKARIYKIPTGRYQGREG